MCRKVQPSIFISKRKCLISTKCYTKDSFRFTSFCFLRVLCFHCCPIPIQLSEIPPACFTSPPTPRYACSQILLLVHFLQQTSSHCPPSFTHTHCSENLTEAARILCRHLTASTEVVCLFRGELQKVQECLTLGHPGKMVSLRCHEGHSRSGVCWDWRSHSSLEPTPDQSREEQ